MMTFFKLMEELQDNFGLMSKVCGEVEFGHRHPGSKFNNIFHIGRYRNLEGIRWHNFWAEAFVIASEELE